MSELILYGCMHLAFFPWGGVAGVVCAPLVALGGACSLTGDCL